MTNVKYGKNKVIFNQGTIDDCMYDIVSGSVAIISGYQTEREKLLAILEAGASFGEMGMIENLPRSAAAVANSETELNVIEAGEFNEYFKDKPGKVLSIIRNTTGRIRALTAEYVDACSCIAQYCECEENGEKVSPELLERLTRISLVGKKK